MNLHAAVIAMLALTLGVAAPAAAGEACPDTPPMVTLHLPNLHAALTHGSELLIVALGSSSTKGTRASVPAHSYPAQLQAALMRALPDQHIVVVNRGVPGEDAKRETARLVADVLAVRPQLVIWQVGANAALRHEDPDAFRALVAAGIRQMAAAGIDVVLMDNQRSPRILASSEDGELNRELAALAAETGAGLFSRDRLMLAWQENGAPPAEFIADDGLHHNDHGYACIANALAEEIRIAIAPPGLSAKR